MNSKAFKTNPQKKREDILLQKSRMKLCSVQKECDKLMQYRDLKFGIQIASDWPQMGQIWDFLRSVSVHFGQLSFNVQD